jgi:hydrogenase maturation factor
VRVIVGPVRMAVRMAGVVVMGMGVGTHTSILYANRENQGLEVALRSDAAFPKELLRQPLRWRGVPTIVGQFDTTDLRSD